MRASLEALQEELSSRRFESVMKAIRRTVTITLENAGMESEVPNALADLKIVYSARSKLTHEGKLKSRDAERRAKDLSKRVLEAALRGGLPA